MQIPEELRKAVIEVTMDHSDVMNAVVREVFPDARITIDCFHTVQVVGDAIEEIRMQSKREAVKEEKKEKTEFRKRLLRNAKKRQKYAEKHPKTYKGKKRGRKPVRVNARYIPTTCPMETLQLTSSESAGTCFCKVERSGLMRKRKEPTYSLASIQKSRRLTVSYALYVPFFETLRSTRKLPSPSSMSGMTRLLRQL